MRLFRLIWVLLIVWLGFWGCGGKSDPEEPSESNQVTAEQIKQLKALKTTVLPWAVTCESNGIQYACEEGSDGDSLLFMGLLCLSGQGSQCTAIPHAIDLDGTLWRAPSRTSWPKGNFSRDMMLGLFAYFIKNPHDKSQLKLFYDYLKDNDNKLCDAVDDRCDMNPYIYRTMWTILGNIWEKAGFTPTWEMKQAAWGDDTLLNIGSNVMPGGFQQHLVAVELYLRREMNTWNDTLQQAANKLASRQPENPFFEYIAHGATKKAAASTLKYCPTKRPTPAKQWWPQRDIAEKAYLNSMGWDCIFLVNLLTQ